MWRDHGWLQCVSRCGTSHNVKQMKIGPCRARDLERRCRHLAPVRLGRWHTDRTAGFFLLVQRCQLWIEDHVGAKTSIPKMDIHEDDLGSRTNVGADGKLTQGRHEVGYLSHSNRHADLLFELISRRYEHKSTVITTNRSFKEWHEVFPNAACVVSLIDTGWCTVARLWPLRVCRIGSTRLRRGRSRRRPPAPQRLTRGRRHDARSCTDEAATRNRPRDRPVCTANALDAGTSLCGI